MLRYALSRVCYGLTRHVLRLLVLALLGSHLPEIARTLLLALWRT